MVILVRLDDEINIVGSLIWLRGGMKNTRKKEEMEDTESNYDFELSGKCSELLRTLPV